MMMSIIARSRSSRFFLIVLHLVCVSTHLQRKQISATTIQNAILQFLPFGDINMDVDDNDSDDSRRGSSATFSRTTATERNSNKASSSSSSSSKEQHNNNNSNRNSRLDPYWLQDSYDQKCLGPMGLFSECGDANLWKVIPKSKRDSKLRQFIRWASEEEEDDTGRDDYQQQDATQLVLGDGYYALQVFDEDLSALYYNNNYNKNSILFDTDQQGQRYPRSVAEQSVASNNNISKKNGSDEEEFKKKDCLTRRRKDNKLVIVSCSHDRAWYWKINKFGTLHFDKPTRGFGGISTNTGTMKQRSLLQQNSNRQHNLESCMWRYHNVSLSSSSSSSSSSEAFLLPCDGNRPTHVGEIGNRKTAKSLLLDEDGGGGGGASENSRVVQMQFVSHNYLQAQPENVIQVPLPPLPRIKGLSKQRQQHQQIDTVEKRNDILNPSLKVSSAVDSTITATAAASEKINLPLSRIDIAHSHASVPPTNRKSVSPLLPFHMTSILQQQKMIETDFVSKQIPRFLGDTNPILIVKSRLDKPASSSTSTPTMKSKSAEGKKQRKKLSSTEQPIIYHSHQHRSASSQSLSEKPIIRKIQMNPYIAASNDERWTDPQTGLVYRTDLCQYLGHERKDAGRHTLTGVAQFTKTMLNIKVYGVGFYASKRDILADPSFEPYASHSSETLRNSPDFYRILRSMKGFTQTPDEPAGSFDRTIFLKINMQLSAATMRSSLDSDWKMLTQEAKDLLINSSMKPRPAAPAFLEIAQSPDNPNRCTCSQIAPEEYNADPSCCARGTELVFTWRKNGNLEVRLNGVFMDSFPRPDIAEGIFFEYLRMDDPMSLDFLNRVVEGFPFLLAPLSQVNGVATPITSHQTNRVNNVAPTSNPVFRFIGGVGGAISSQAASLADLVQSGAHEISGGTMNRARTVGSAARKMGEEVERRRDLISKHVTTFTNQALSPFYPSGQKSISIPFPGWITDSELEEIDNLFQQNSATIPNHETAYTRTISRIIGLQDTSMSASNVTQKLIFGMVHLYLLLLLIASFPAKWSTRTKLIITRRKTESSSSYVVASVPIDSENSDSDESGMSSSVEIVDEESMMKANDIHLKKSLSYVL